MGRPGHADDGKVVRYAEVRSSIKSGDVLLFQGTGWFSRLIRWGTRSRFSHSGVAFWWGSRLVVLEATRPEVRAMPLSVLVGHYPRVDLLTPRHAVDALAMLREAQVHLGKRYAIWGAFRFARRILLRLRGGADPARPPDKFLCSQFVSLVYRAGAHKDLDKHDPDAFTSPEAIRRSELLHHVGRLKG